MKVLVVEMRAVSDGEVVSGTVMVQRKRGDSWIQEQEITVVSNQPGARRELLLDDTQRLVIEAKSNREVVYDRNQAAAVSVQTDTPLPRPTPLVADGDERDTDVAGPALRGEGFSELAARERQDAAISAARERLKAQQQAPEPEAKPAVDPFATVDSPAVSSAAASGVPEPKVANGPKIKLP